MMKINRRISIVSYKPAITSGAVIATTICVIKKTGLELTHLSRNINWSGEMLISMDIINT
jgi:hypothetical protein